MIMNYDVFYDAIFIGKKEYGGFKLNKKYSIKATENRPYGVMLFIIDENGLEMRFPYCNIRSVGRCWKIID